MQLAAGEGQPCKWVAPYSETAAYLEWYTQGHESSRGGGEEREEFSFIEH